MPNPKQRTILTIEDDTFVRKAIAAFLGGQNFHILEADDGEEGLSLWHEKQPDLVLTDLRLPKYGGLEILKIIHNESPETPVIIVSGMATVDDAIKAINLGAWDYVPKPITDMNFLVHAISKAFKQVDLLAENKQYQLHLEEMVKRRTAELHQAQRLEAIGTLAGGIAHDFNNILAAIIGYTELTLLKNKDNTELCADLKQVQCAGDRARDLVAQILTFARKSDTEYQALLISPIIKEALKLLRATIPSTVTIHQHIYEGPEKIIANATEIHQVIMNLCTNSFQAMANEQGVLTIDLYLTAAPETGTPAICIEVKDDGVGMTEDEQKKIFDPFFTTKAKGTGTGLGLSVVHGIVTSCKGSISVESNKQTGSTFKLFFPVTASTKEETSPTQLPFQGGCEHILFVDDEDNLRHLVNHMLTSLGYSAEIAPSGDKALTMLEKSNVPFDLIITDQTMPYMPGTELAREIRQTHPEIPIILCTGYSSMVNEKTAQEFGIQGFLQKPFTMQMLAQEIRTVLGDTP